MNKKRQEIGLKSEKQVLHMLFKGNPGTGKTTVARMIGKLLFEMNILSKGHLVEAERADACRRVHRSYSSKNKRFNKKSNGRNFVY